MFMLVKRADFVPGGPILQTDTKLGGQTQAGSYSLVCKIEQVLIELVLIGGSEPMRRTRVNLQDHGRHDLRGHAAGMGAWHDLVVVAMDHQGRYIDLLQVPRCRRRDGQVVDAGNPRRRFAGEQG